MTAIVSGVSPNSGPASGSGTNQIVTITGSGFTGALAVQFNGVGAISFTVVSDTTITTSVPVGVANTTVDVQVDVPQGLSQINPSDKYSYTNAATIAVTSISPQSGSTLGSGSNQILTITGYGFTGATAVQFNGVGSTAFTVISDTKITTAIPATTQAGSVNVQVNIPTGLSAKNPNDVFTYEVVAAPGVPMLFASSEALTDTYIQFLGGTVVGTYYDQNGNFHNLQSNTAYSLQDITSGSSVAPNLPNDVPAVLIQSFSGRLYVSFGSGLVAMQDGYIPAAQLQSDPNFNIRYQYIEPTVTNSQLNVDLSYIDFTAISISLDAVNAPDAQNGSQISQSSLSMATAAGAAATPVNASVLPAPADQLPNPAFLRVISPQLAGQDVYHDFTHYLQTTLAAATVRIAGTYVGTGPQPASTPAQQAQCYDFTATFDTCGNVTLTPNADSGNGYAPGVPVVQQGPGVGASTSIIVQFSDLNASTGIYGCNAPYTLDTTPAFISQGLTNDFWGQVVGDLLAGLNFGYVGSTALFNNVVIGGLSSSQWWGGTMPDGTPVVQSATPGSNGVYFSAVQGNALDYNGYAGQLSSLTSGYGFPLQDRLQNNLLSMNTAVDQGSYLIVSVDITPVGNSGGSGISGKSSPAKPATLSKASKANNNLYQVMNSWGGTSGHQGGVMVLGGRAGQKIVSVDISSHDGGKTLVGTMTYLGEGEIGFKATLLGANLYVVENSWGGTGGHPGGKWIIGGRSNQNVVALKLSSKNNGDTLEGTMTYAGEGPIGFIGTSVDGGVFEVENRWGGEAAPWHDGGLWVLGCRDQGLVALNVKGNGKTLSGTNTYACEGVIGFVGALEQGNNYAVENSWGGTFGYPGGMWLIGARDSQHVVALDITSTDGGKSLSGSMTYQGEGPISFRASLL